VSDAARAYLLGLQRCQESALVAELDAKSLQVQHFMNKRRSESFNRSTVSSAHHFATLPSTNMLKINQHITTLSKAFLTAGLLGGAAVATLGAGSAQAGTCTFGVLGSSCFNWIDTIGDKKLTVKNTQAQLDSLSPGDLEFTSGGGFWFVDIDWTPNIMGPIQGSIQYTLEILDPNMIFNTAKLNATLPVDGGTQNDSVFTKQIEYLVIDPTLTVLGNGEDGPVSIIPAKEILVTDSWDIKTGDQADNMMNTFDQIPKPVPAPLPILGAGAAFGSIRKLRKFSARLKTFSMG
jgi:hypothetical protein